MQVRQSEIEIRSSIISSIKPFLQAEMRKKLDPSARWSYCHLSETDAANDSFNQMHGFIDYHLDDFISRCTRVLPYLMHIDIESIGTESLTPIAKEFIALFDHLEKNGFAGVSAFDERITFWSGQVAKKKVIALDDEISDSKVPAVSVMFDVCRAIHQAQKKYDDYITLLTCATSRVFATNASEAVNVYISSEKVSELPGFTVPNNFWLAELPTLRHLYQRGIISDIIINLYNQHTGQWDSGVSLFSAEGANIPVYRRNRHRLDGGIDTGRFKSLNMSEDDRRQWINAKSRPYITYGKLTGFAKTLALVWRNRSKQVHSPDQHYDQSHSKHIGFGN